MSVGIIGLGIMGSAYAGNFIKAGLDVIGADPAPESRAKLEAAGGTPRESVGPWVTDCDLVIISVASPDVLEAVSTQLGNHLKPGQIVLETGTFAMADKNAAREAVEAGGAILLDTPVSGTGVQAVAADLVIMASGPSEAIAQAKPFMQHLCHTIMEAGDFGAGTNLKFVANHAIALHNCAAAETLHYADALGLDRDTVYKLLSKGAATSKMLELRMPLMISGSYTPATAHMTMFKKDLSIIGADIRAHGIHTPLFDAATDLYDKSYTLVPMSYDTAAVFEVYRDAETKT